MVMKNKIIILLISLPFLFSSCDGFLDKFDHFGVGDTFEASFDVDLKSSEPGDFEGSVSFDATDDAVLDENLDNIDEFEVTRIGLQITSFDGVAGAMATGFVSISSNGENIGEPVALSIDLNSDAEMELPFTSGTFDEIKQAYLDNKVIEITGSGSISDVPAKVEFTIYMTVEATIRN